MKPVSTSHHALGAITTAKASAIRYGPLVRQARRAVGSSSRKSPSVTARGNAAYFDQNASARHCAGEQPVGGALAGERTMKEQAGERPERQLPLVVGEFHHGKIVEVDAFQHEHRDQCLERADKVARQAARQAVKQSTAASGPSR